MLRYFGTFYTRRTMVRSGGTDCERLKRLHLYDDVFLHKFGGFPKWLSIILDFSLSVRLRLFFRDSQEKKVKKQFSRLLWDSLLVFQITRRTTLVIFSIFLLSWKNAEHFTQLWAEHFLIEMEIKRKHTLSIFALRHLWSERTELNKITFSQPMCTYFLSTNSI